MKNDPCQIALALEVIGGKWKGPIIFWIKDQPRRFNELRRLLGDITQRTLTTQLREMERDGLVVRTQYNEIPPKVEYSASTLCLSLLPLLDHLHNWGKTNTAKIDRARQNYAKKSEE